MRDERRKEERSKQDQTNNKAKQHSTPEAVIFPKKNELPQVGLEPMTLHVCGILYYRINSVFNVYVAINLNCVD